MATGGASGYASLNARVRVKYSTLLTAQDYGRLSEAPDFAGVIAQLKHTEYGPYLENIKDKDLSPRRAVFEIKARLANAYRSIIQSAPGYARPLLDQLFRLFEVDNLKAVLRGILSGATWDTVRYVLFPLGETSALPAQEMLEAGNVSAAVELLKGTPYYETLSHAMKRYNIEQNLFPLEVALDLDYWRKLWVEVKRLPIEDQTQATKIIGSLLDVNNMMWAIRYRVYHHLSEEELINYTLPFGYHVRDEDIRSIAAGADIAHIVTRLFPDVPNVDELLLEPRSGLPQLELELKRYIIRRCQAAFLGNPFHIGLPLAYLILTEFEIEDLTVILEAKSNELPVEEYQSYLLAESVAK